MKVRLTLFTLSSFILSSFALSPFRPLTLFAAQQPPIASERPPALTVDFVAVQPDGTPILDLQSSEVEIRIGDRPRALRSLRRVATAPAGATVGVPLPYGTNASIASGRTFIIVIDQESLVAERDQSIRSAVDGLLATFTPADRAMVALLPFGGVRVPFTSSAARIRQGLAGPLSSTGSRNETGSELACRTRRFLETLDVFFKDLSGPPTPLTVAVFTAGLAAPRRDRQGGLIAPRPDDVIGMAPGMCELRTDDFLRLAASAGAARANVYVVQPIDIGMNPSASRETIGGAGFSGSTNPLEGIEHFAGVTGAVRLPLDATGTASLLRVAKESAAFYEAELEPLPNETFGRSQPLRVRVSRRAVTVRARPEITLKEPRRATAATRLAVNNLLTVADAFTDLRLRVGAFTVRDTGAQLRVGVLVETVDPAVTLESVGAILVDEADRIVARWSGRDATERPLMGAMIAAPGTYRLRVAAIDTAGRPGAAEDVVVVGLTPVGPLSLGSLMLGVSRPEGPRPQLEYGSEPTATASFDIYGGDSSVALTPSLEIAREIDGPAIATLPLALARASEERVVATGVVPVGALAPGDYVIRGVIRLQDGTTGRVMRTLRKVAR